VRSQRIEQKHEMTVTDGAGGWRAHDIVAGDYLGHLESVDT
jgi:hypothetical protein